VAAWDRAYEAHDRPNGRLAPPAAEAFLLSWQEELRAEMAAVCSGSPKAELFLALRTLPPGQPGGYQLEPLSDHPLTAMAVRRVATHAALRYAADPPADYDAPYGRSLAGGDERSRFAEALIKLLYLASYYMMAYGYRPPVARGNALEVSYDSVRLDPEGSGEFDLLSFSLDGRKHENYSPFARIGEFVADAVPVLNPQGAALVSTSYERLDNGDWRYRALSWGLAPVRDFLLEIEPSLAVGAWGMRGEEFAVLLAALCHIVAKEIGRSTEALADVEASSVVRLKAERLEGAELLEHAEQYLKTLDLDPGDFDLRTARDSFLHLACSKGKEAAREKALTIQLADTRFSYLLHRFGRYYVADSFHADHWLHRPLELLAGRMTDRQAEEKGKRFERRLRDFAQSRATTLRPVPEISGKLFDRAGAPAGDLDCVLRIGEVLLLVEAKARLVRYQAETVYRAAVLDRWKEARGFIEQAERTARLLAAQRELPRFGRGLANVRYILPVVCTPYPEFVNSLEDRYWIRKPDRASQDVGVPRLLTPYELLRYFDGKDDRAIIEAAGAHMIELDSVPKQ
jgi:hypothetical protein